MRINRRARVRRPGLTTVQKLDLICGEGICGRAFETAAARRASWYEHRAEVMANIGPLQRPAAYWDYDALKLPCEKDLPALKRLNLLTPAEQLIVMDRKTKRGSNETT